MNTSEIDKLDFSENEELVKREDIQDSPFQVITIEGKSFGVIGKYRVTPARDTPEEVKKELKNKTWNRLVQVMLILIESTKDVEFKDIKA